MFVPIAALLLVLPADGEPLDHPKLLAHYMPWFDAPPHSPKYGYHWTMNRFDPAATPPTHAATETPAIGLYDSSDPAVLEYHVLTMKVAGIDGVIVDWYGISSLWDYPKLHANTQRLLDVCDRFGLQYAICYEDKTIANRVTHDGLAEAERVAAGIADLRWLAESVFSRPGQLRLDGRPVLLSFGNAGLSDEEWSAVLDAMRNDTETNIAYFSEHRRRPAAVAAYDWPLPSKGIAAAEAFNAKNVDNGRTRAIPVAYPQFDDFYAEAGVGEGYPVIPANRGRTFRKTLLDALATNPRFVQIATWNDWGEGTQIEPSRENAAAYLDRLQTIRRLKIEPSFRPTRDDLTLPRRLLAARRAGEADAAELDAIAAAISRFEFETARAALEE